MTTTVGLFTSRSDAEDAVARLRAAGIAPDQINLLTPGTPPSELRRVPTSDTEPPGVGPALGGVVGAAAGAAGGMQAAVAVSALLPGVGPVIALGVLAGALVGAGGGAAIGSAAESLGAGVPKDELFLYQDALRQGRSVLFVLAPDDEKAALARRIIYEAGAESLDTARERWWLGLRNAEAERYGAEGGDFNRDEVGFRLGFEAAMRLKPRDAAYEDVVEYFRQEYPDAYRDPAFRRGFERGRAYDIGTRHAA